MSFISYIKTELLIEWIDSEISSGVTGDLDRQAIEKIIRSIFGNSLLRNKGRLTEFIFLNSDELQFRSLCDQLNVSEHGRMKYDVSVEIATKPFTEKSPLAAALKKVFSIEDAYMPISELTSETVSHIEPVSLVPPAYDYQLEIIDKIKVFLDSEQSAALMQLPTGSGKTRVAIQAIVERLWDTESLMHSFVWLAHTQELCEQAYETFRRLWIANGNAPIKTYRLWGGRKANVNSTQSSAIFTTFGTFTSMQERNELLDLIPKLHCVVVDEAHRASSRVFGRVIQDLKLNAKIIGLTATPGRHADSDSDNMALRQLFDSTLISSAKLGEDPIRELQKRGILAIPKIRFIEGSDYEIFGESGGEISNGTLFALGVDESRNRIIVDELCKLVAQGHKALVFSCSVEHSKLLVAGLAAKNISASYVDSNMSSGRRMGVINMFSRGEITVLVNYGILSTGFDVPDISAVVITRPTSSIVLYSQMLGRGMRGISAGGSDDFVVLDIRDNTDSFGEVNDVYNYFEGLWS